MPEHSGHCNGANGGFRHPEPMHGTQPDAPAGRAGSHAASSGTRSAAMATSPTLTGPSGTTSTLSSHQDLFQTCPSTYKKLHPPGPPVSKKPLSRSSALGLSGRVSATSLRTTTRIVPGMEPSTNTPRHPPFAYPSGWLPARSFWVTVSLTWLQTVSGQPSSPHRRPCHRVHRPGKQSSRPLSP